jgi:hypothetical protein
MNIHELNKIAWDQAVAEGTNPYTFGTICPVIMWFGARKWEQSFSLAS